MMIESAAHVNAHEVKNCEGSLQSQISPVNNKLTLASCTLSVSQHLSDSAVQFCDGGTVTKGKLHLFLTERVVGRESKKKKGSIIGGSTVCGYVNAIVDLYNQQVALRINSTEHPRSPQVKQLIRNPRQQKPNYQDRGVGFLLDGYQSEVQFRQICDSFLDLDDLRGRAAFFVSHYGLLRGENIRDLELVDMFSQDLDREC
ncbi:hypothetical protein PHMEG_0003350 [Phytophthora megakarya]|uniref:Uncharacterized protein n=1 Tax=Phytophthora megakarya TaxID=4795 RepID=A0A225WWG9_9STRA|nr:hypothetical protein PHMEG_0003350 [Phytophthora megakarya]